MKELLIDTLQEKHIDGGAHGFSYYILVGQMEVNGGFACESYGVKIAQADGSEVATIPDITTSVSRIDELMDLLIRNLVTPTALPDIIADWL